MDRYDEALAKARAEYEKARKQGYTWLMNLLEGMFPEMKESEDERIYNEIMEFFRMNEKRCIVDNSYTKWIAWLEKQKEQTEQTEELSTRLNGLMQEYVKAGKDEEEQEHRLKCYQLFWDALGDSEFFKQEEQKLHLTVKGNGVYKICPHCKSRMIRDDSKVYTSMPPQYGYNCPKCGTMEFDTVMYDNPEMEEQKPAECADGLVEEAEEYTSKVACGEYGVEVTEAYIAGVLSERNRGTDWSEEDEDMLNRCISSIEEAKENRYAYKENDGDTSYDHEIAWLKSILPLLHWKPSEEQMEALKKTIRLANFGLEEDRRKALESLYEQLKKLM